MRGRCLHEGKVIIARTVQGLEIALRTRDASLLRLALAEHAINIIIRHPLVSRDPVCRAHRCSLRPKQNSIAPLHPSGMQRLAELLDTRAFE